MLFSITRKDFEVTWFSGTGAGGQHRNKHQNCCRLTHVASRATVTGQNHRSRQANLKDALHRIMDHVDFRTWMARKTQEVLAGETIERAVDKQMASENLRVEGVDDNGKWVEILS